MRLCALVLAGGASRRYAGNKLLSTHPAGGTLIEHVLGALAPLACHTLVVTGKWHDALSPVLANQPVTVSYNPGWQKGMGASLAHGIKIIHQQWPETTHAFVCVGDLPAVTSSSLLQLSDVASHFPDRIVASAWLDIVGVPAIFPASYFSQLTGLRGDHGAGGLIRHALHCAPAAAIAVPHAEAGWDIDKQEDWQADDGE